MTNTHYNNPQGEIAALRKELDTVMRERDQIKAAFEYVTECAAARKEEESSRDVTHLRAEVETLRRERDEAIRVRNEAILENNTTRQQRDELSKELERERMRLAACGTAALGYFDGCADEYKSASLDDVLRLRQHVQELESALQAADEGRNYANQLLTEQSQRVRELQERIVLLEAMHQSALLTVGVRNQELAALRKRIDDAPVVGYAHPKYKHIVSHVRWADYCQNLIKQEDLM